MASTVVAIASPGHSILSVAANAHFRSEVLDELLTAIGATTTTPLRLLAVIPPDRIRALLPNMTDSGGQPLTLLDHASARVAMSVVREVAAKSERIPRPLPAQELERQMGPRA